MAIMNDDDRASRYFAFQKQAERLGLDQLRKLKKQFTQNAINGKTVSGDRALEERSAHLVNKLIQERLQNSAEQQDAEHALRRNVIERAAKASGQSVANMEKHIKRDATGRKFERLADLLASREERYQASMRAAVVAATGQPPVEKEHQ